MIACLDYGLGNLASVRNAFGAAGAEIVVTSDPSVIERARGVVLPGVGAASAGMRGLEERGLVEVVRKAGRSGRPFIGLCLGMQLLFDRSEEGDAACLGLLPGTVERLRSVPKVPHMGWNQVERRADLRLWEGLPERPYFYFVHSYICRPSDAGMVAGTTQYGGDFCSAVSRGLVWGTQFHPERSGAMGHLLIRNFVAACERA